MLDVVVNDLASQYAIQTEAALGTLVAGAGQQRGADRRRRGRAGRDAASSEALWTAVANVYAATKGVGRVALVVPPARLG